MKIQIKYYLMIAFVLFTFLLSMGQRQTVEEKMNLSLTKTIGFAIDSSLYAFQSKHSFMSGFWQYKTFQAQKLPILEMNIQPVQYSRNIVKRYDSQKDLDVYRTQQNFFTSANLSIRQNLGLTGGTFFMDSDIGFLKNIGLTTQKQFSSVPFRIGYSQSIFGYNSFKWDKKIEPIHYEYVQKKFLYELEEISELAVEYFFNLALAQTFYDLSIQNLANSDTLYAIGLEQNKIGKINPSDLLTLKLDAIRANDLVENADMDLQNATWLLSSFLRLPSNMVFVLSLPEAPISMSIRYEDALRLAKKNHPIVPRNQENLLAARKELEKSKRESRFAASLSASIGFNQVASSIQDAYRKPLQQDLISVSLTIPLIDWGIGKGQVNMARSNLNTTVAAIEQEEAVFEQEVIKTIRNFEVKYKQIATAKEAEKVAEAAYEKAKQLFKIGKENVTGLNMAQSKRIEAKQNYISVLKDYWTAYYKIRKLTLHDFKNGQDIVHRESQQMF